MNGGHGVRPREVENVPAPTAPDAAGPDAGGPDAAGPDAGGPDAAAARPSLQVLERAFAILEAFTEFRTEWSTSDLARFLELPIPTVHRLLGALARLGYVSRDEQTRRFRLGGAAMRLGERARAVSDLRAVALRPLRRLSEATDETAVLTVLSHDRHRSVCLERVETSQPLRLSVQPGSQLPLHAGASQKALLAFMPEREVGRLLARPLERFCTATITDPGRLRRDLEVIRERGWAGSYEETNLGVWGIAVPVISEDDVVCAVGIAGPSARLSDDVFRRDVPSVQRAALAVARSLGLAVPPVTLPTGRATPPQQRERNP
jgi:IclR family transcriptional regulator, acetate operon repressor